MRIETQHKATAMTYIDKTTDTIFFVGVLEVPGQKLELVNTKYKVLELTNENFVVRYNQVVPFTRTLQTITQTYMRVP